MVRRIGNDLRITLRDIYSPRNEYSKGRLMALGDALITAFYNVFITGIFYTGFLSMYGISITNVGILTFMPFIANSFSVFSPMILERIKRRKPVLVAAKLLFYFIYIVATTVMPNFVQDTQGRVIWFVALVFVAHAMYAMFSPGFTPWFYRFYPEDNERRMRYIMFNQMFSSIMSSLVLISSSLITDAMAGSPYQGQLIIGLRYFAFVLVILDVFIQSRAKEFPYPEAQRIKFREVFTEPFKYRRFMMCMALMFYWNYVANLNNGLWNYHLLNHLDFSYTLINALAVMYTIIFFALQKTWRRVIRRYSWVKTFGICNLLWFPSEIVFFFMNPQTTGMFIPMGIYQHLIAVGLNLSYSNILYINLPEEKSTVHLAFYTVGCNLFAFLGLMTGTMVSSITGDSTFSLLGMPVYSVQFTTLLRAAFMCALGVVLFKNWRRFERDENIRQVEQLAEESRQLRNLPKNSINVKAALQRALRRRVSE